MGRKTKEELKTEEEEWDRYAKEMQEFIPMQIIDDGKQLSIRIPKKAVEALDIDSKKDLFIFCLEKKSLDLFGYLQDKEKWEESQKAKQDGKESNK